MREEQRGMWCVLAFGMDPASARQDAIERGCLPEDASGFTVNNPVPTGDHWRTLGWVNDLLRSDERFLASLPQARRPFVRHAGGLLAQSPGCCLCMVIASPAARRFRDENGLRSQRGRVYAFFGRRARPVEGVVDGDASIAV